ncbi:HAD family hydrolase [Paenibacillus sp. Z6-24]
MNLLIDVDDTLYDQLTPFTEAYQSVFGQLYEDGPVDQIFIKSRVYSDEVFEQVSSGQMSNADMHVYRMTRAMEDCGMRITAEQALAFQERYAEQQQRIVVDPQMEELLDFAIRIGIRLGIITNGPAEHQASKVRQLRMNRWVEEQNVFISGQLGIAKPDTGLFRHVEQSMNIRPEESYYIGDSYANDIVGAKRAGWQSIWMNPRQHQIPEQAEYRPDYVADGEHPPLEILRAIWSTITVSEES